MSDTERREYTEEEIDLVCFLIQKGEDDETIARICRRSPKAIEAFRSNYNFLKKAWRFRR